MKLLQTRSGDFFEIVYHQEDVPLIAAKHLHIGVKPLPPASKPAVQTFFTQSGLPTYVGEVVDVPDQVVGQIPTNPADPEVVRFRFVAPLRGFANGFKVGDFEPDEVAYSRLSNNLGTDAHETLRTDQWQGFTEFISEM